MTSSLRIVSKLVAYFAAVLTLAALVFCVWQTREAGRDFRKPLEDRALASGSEVRSLVEPLLDDATAEPLRTALEGFVQKEGLFGAIVEDEQGLPKAASQNLTVKLQKSPTVWRDIWLVVVRWSVGDARYVSLNGRLCFASPLSLQTKEGKLRTLMLFYDADPLSVRALRIWLNNFLRLLVQIVLVSITVPVVLYFNVLNPIQKTTQWLKKIRLGEETSLFHPRGGVLFKSLTHEVTQIATSLSTARQEAEEEARLRHFSESLWTPARLKEFVKSKINGRPIFVVSNREPYRHVQKGKEIVCEVPASGLVTAIEPILTACGGTWIAQADGDADHLTVDSHDRLKVPPEQPQYNLRRVWITKEEEQGFYYGFSNEGLWPLCHIAHTRPIFRDSDWRQYVAANEKFAKAVLGEIENVEAPYVLIQDYHFALLPEMIKVQRPDARVALFWHIPWPNPESFGICPWQKQVLKGMMGADIIGFHTQFHCNNFLDTVDRFLESRIDYENFSIHREGSITWVKPFPISIAFSDNAPASANGTVPVSKENLLKPYGISVPLIGVGVDRLDYTKGIPERFRSVEHLLLTRPAYMEKFTFVELAAPSRSLIPKYQEFEHEVEREVERINNRFKTKNWKPILFLKKTHTHREIAPFYKAADVCMVTSLHDGMNLVAKEFVMARSDERGALILSQFTGASRELTDALVVNPYDIVQMADAIDRALKMPIDEQQERMRQMRQVLRERNVYRWAADLVGELGQVRVSNAPKVLV